MDRTFVYESATPIPGIIFKFPMGHFYGLLAHLTVEGTVYKMYHFSPAYQVCIQAEGKGVLTLNTWIYIQYAFGFSGTAVTFSGAEMGFDPSQTECRDASNLAPEVFGW